MGTLIASQGHHRMRLEVVAAGVCGRGMDSLPLFVRRPCTTGCSAVEGSSLPKGGLVAHGWSRHGPSITADLVTREGGHYRREGGRGGRRGQGKQRVSLAPRRGGSPGFLSGTREGFRGCCMGGPQSLGGGSRRCPHREWSQRYGCRFQAFCSHWGGPGGPGISPDANHINLRELFLFLAPAIVSHEVGWRELLLERLW